jgi:hypothetical protein
MIVLEGSSAPPYRFLMEHPQHVQPGDTMFDAEFKGLVDSVEHHLDKEEHEFVPEVNKFWEKIRYLGSEDGGTRATGEVS